ncbi:hypothetical protein [Fulvivirga sp.]|uniref:hypothetical protein n=1 Tax=Fulvivirga sp. TaxID=1931237 RepID=UPI0032EE90E7
MKKLRYTIIALFLTILVSCSQKNETDSYAGLDYEEICEEFDKYAFEQKALLDQIRAKYKGDKHFINSFNQEQISWIQYQDKRLRALYPKDWDTYYRKNYGEPAFNGCKCKELIRLSKIRNEDLKIYLEGPDAGQKDCPIQGNN